MGRWCRTLASRRWSAREISFHCIIETSTGGLAREGILLHARKAAADKLYHVEAIEASPEIFATMRDEGLSCWAALEKSAFSGVC